MKKSKQRIISIALAALVGGGCAAGLLYDRWVKNQTIQTVVDPTCTENGYIVTTVLYKETTTVENLPARGHTFGEWITDETAALQTRTCSACQFQEQVRLSAEVSALPKLYLTGSMEGIGKKNRVALEAEFSSVEDSFSCYALTTLQGHSTFGYPKHNYTLRFYDDAQGVSKHRLQFQNWHTEHKYVLKANYLDLTQCRNLVGARIWADMAATRQNLHQRLASLCAHGAVDGFPVEVYLNGEFFGLYTLNLHKDNDLYQMTEREYSALLICNQSTTDESLFRAPAAFAADYSSDWEMEFCGTEDETWAKESFNRLISFVMQSSDEEFRAELSSYLDTEAAIDYLLFIYALGLPDSAAKDLVLLNYGDVWIPSVYDMDEAFGLDTDTFSCISPEEFLPQKTDGLWHSGTKSLLWDRLLNNFETEIRERYTQLRRALFTEEHFIQLVESYISAIPETLYDMDLNLYTNRPMMDTEMKEQIIDYISKRFNILDTILEVDAK